MREIALFVEDSAHQKVIGVLVQRLADGHRIPVRMNWVSSEGGHGRVIHTFRAYLHDLRRRNSPLPDLIVVATDANCSGMNDRTRQISGEASAVEVPLPPIVLAIPDPHIERWLLLDGSAFRRVLGQGCDAPDQKCSRNLYKERLTDAVLAAGTEPLLGGIEFAEDIVRAMDLDRAKRADDSLRHFLDNLGAQFRQWTM